MRTRGVVCRTDCSGPIAEDATGDHLPAMPNARPLFRLQFATALLLAACGGSKTINGAGKAEAEPPRLVRAVPVGWQGVQREIRTTAFLESEHQASVTARTGGRLMELRVDTGSRVEKGEVLARLDDRQARSALQQLTVQKSARELDRQLAEVEVEAAQKRVQQAGFEVEKAKAEFDRQSSMQKEFVAPKALQDSELLFKAADQALQVAQFNKQKAGLEVQRIANSVEELAAKIKENEIQLEDHEIIAPFAGVITQRHIAGGATITANQPLFEMVDPLHLIAWLDRPQQELDLVRKAKAVKFATDAMPGKEYTGSVDLISPVVDRDSGHFQLRMRVAPQDAGELVPGMFVRARILAEDERQALMVPKTAVLSEGEVSVVMVVRGGRACRLDLDPGIELQDRIECRNTGDGGLHPGDLVITSGHDDLADQAEVQVAQ